MSTGKANGLTLLVGSIRVPRVGVWVAEVELDGEDASKVSGAVTIELGSTTWKGTAIESGVFAGRLKARIFGGTGGLRKPTTPKFYASMPARTIVTELLREGGESLSTTSDATALAKILPFWTRPAGTVSEGLENVLDEIGASWRVLQDGTVWIGTETWPEAKVADVHVESEDPKDSKMVIGSEDPSLVPGTTFQSRKVSRVEHEISSGKTRTVAFFDATGNQPLDPLRAALDGIIRQSTKHFDFFAVRAGKAVAQNGDGTLEIKLDDDDMPGMSKIPIAYGIPGVTAKVKAGARVHVEFVGGSPKNPRAIVVDSSGAIELKLDADVRVVGGGDFVALAKKVDDIHKAIKTMHETHVHPTGVGPSGPPVAPVPPTVTQSVACTKLKTD